jgi:hypothetical protein
MTSLVLCVVYKLNLYHLTLNWLGVLSQEQNLVFDCLVYEKEERTITN